MSIKSFKKKLEKAGASMGFSHITQWLSYPNLAMNWVATGSFRRGVPNKRSTLIGGVSGGTKSLNTLRVASEAQKHGYTVVFLDSEAAISEQDLEMNGVDYKDEDKFIAISVVTIEEVMEIFAESLRELDENSKICFVLDSASGLSTDLEDEAAEKGKLQNDQGLISRKSKQLIKLINSKIRDRDWFFLLTGHVYENPDKLSGDGKYKFSNLGAAMYYPSVTLQLTKLNLKDGAEQVGIKVDVTTRKTRFNQVGKKVRLELEYDKGGFDKYDGVLKILVDNGYVDQSGAWYSYPDDNGEVVKFQSKKFHEHAELLIDRYEEDHSKFFVEDDELTEGDMN